MLRELLDKQGEVALVQWRAACRFRASLAFDVEAATVPPWHVNREPSRVAAWIGRLVGDIVVNRLALNALFRTVTLAAERCCKGYVVRVIGLPIGKMDHVGQDGFGETVCLCMRRRGDRWRCGACRRTPAQGRSAPGGKACGTAPGGASAWRSADRYDDDVQLPARDRHDRQSADVLAADPGWRRVQRRRCQRTDHRRWRLLRRRGLWRRRLLWRW